ncbi:unnamed protein product [Mytilus coruscus]|uniref:Uncharacterized protein n=1 Tax=Mytilus coruscus TaxID=42192 RepID=A0A6J8D7R8_MYTCO|nr:unnamed protein product [Mytilus coruscus]
MQKNEGPAENQYRQNIEQDNQNRNNIEQMVEMKLKQLENQMVQFMCLNTSITTQMMIQSQKHPTYQLRWEAQNQKQHPQNDQRAYNQGQSQLHENDPRLQYYPGQGQVHQNDQRQYKPEQGQFYQTDQRQYNPGQGQFHLNDPRQFNLGQGSADNIKPTWPPGPMLDLCPSNYLMGLQNRPQPPAYQQTSYHHNNKRVINEIHENKDNNKETLNYLTELNTQRQEENRVGVLIKDKQNEERDAKLAQAIDRFANTLVLNI